MGLSPQQHSAGLFVSARYRVLRKLGSGSLGTVYLAHDTASDCRVALKVLRAERLGPEVLEQMQSEFQAIASLRHPQIAAAFDFGYTEEARVPFYTREYIEGTPLAAGPPGLEGQASPRTFLSPFFDLLDALHYLHAHEILHLDIHAGNVIVAKDPKRGSVLIDFGWITKASGTRSSAVTPSRCFLPPEMLSKAPVGAASDLYSVGSLLLFRLTGNPEGEAKLPREMPGWGPRLTLELERILGKALQRDARQRFQSAAEFREALSLSLGDKEGAPRLVEPGEITRGRDAMLDAIEEKLRIASTGKSSVLWFVGPMGAGKSRLLTEARWRAQVRGFEVVSLRFLSGSSAEPSFLKALRSTSRGHRKAWSWLAPLRTKHGGSTVERARRAAQAYFEKAGSPLVILVDDTEHGDRESLILLEALISECLGREKEALSGRGLAILVASAKKPAESLFSTPLSGGLFQALPPLKTSEAVSVLSTLLRPLKASKALLRRFATQSQGLPLRLRQIARYLHARWGVAGAIPPEALIPPGFFKAQGNVANWLKNANAAGVKVSRTLAILQRPAEREAIAGVSGLPRRTVSKALRALKEEELVTENRQGRLVTYQLASPEAAAELSRGAPKRETFQIHERMATFLRRIHRQDPSSLENLARHLLLAGRTREGCREAWKAAPALRAEGHLQSAIQLLATAASSERNPRKRLKYIEEMSEIHEEAGDHKEGVSLLSSFHPSALRFLSRSDVVRLGRRLGVHYHRAGMVPEALQTFQRALELADRAADLQEVVSIDSELAELHTLRGDYGLAEDACQRGLELLALVKKSTIASASKEKRGRLRHQMEVTLRASSGHLKLRRMELEAAKEDLEAAADLASGSSTTALQALILNNLGIVQTQRNKFSAAKQCFQKARRLLVSAGEHRGIIQIACNLALIAAKTGDAEGAQEHMARVSQLLPMYPDERLEFFSEQTRGTVAYLLGDAASALKHFETSLPLGRKLGDSHLVHFGEVFFSEAHLACGHYGEALQQLRLTGIHAAKNGPPLLQRMLYSRLLLLEALLGRERAGEAVARALTNIPQSNVSLLEAWNNLYIAAALSLRPKGEGVAWSRLGPPARLFAQCSESFRQIGIPAGEKFAEIGLFFHALRQGDLKQVEGRLERIQSKPGRYHRTLTVLQPLAEAEGYLFLNDLERARACLDEAAGAIVGLPFLELDWRIEFLRALLSERQGDREGSRRFLHRSLHTQDLLARLVPAGHRRTFLSHDRFLPLAELTSRSEKPSLLKPSTSTGAAPQGFAGILGRSSAMQRVFRTLEKLRDQEIPVVITGETGTGKELVARAIHETSPRRNGRFLALHCASLPPELFESELFGYAAGAFTGAEDSHEGLLEHLGRGTLLFDEVTSLSPLTQAKLLRVLDARTVRPLGSSSPRPVDVRFLASSSLDLAEAVKAKTFRADLYFRLRGAEIHLPPLRARADDIPLLAQHYLQLHAKRLGRSPLFFTTEALDFLQGHGWPGNVRELETVLVRLLVTSSPRAAIGVEALRPLLPRQEEDSLFSDDLLAGRDIKDLKRNLERAYLRRLFKETGGDIEKMSENLAMKRVSLYLWFRRIGMDVHALRREL